MQPITTRTVQNQIAEEIQKKTSDQNQAPAKKTTDVQSTNSATIPEDIVSLSTASIVESAKNKKPSTPVSRAEKESLLNNSSSKPNISTYV